MIRTKKKGGKQEEEKDRSHMRVRIDNTVQKNYVVYMHNDVVVLNANTQLCDDLQYKMN